MFSPHNVSIHKVTPNTKPFPTKRFLHKITKGFIDTMFFCHKMSPLLLQKHLLFCYKISPLLLKNVSFSVTKFLLFWYKNVSFCYKMSPLLLQNFSSSVKKCLLFCYKMIMLQNIYFLKCFHKCVLLENKLY